MRVEILGPVRVWCEGTELDTGPPRQRAVLGLLAAACGQPLSRAELVDALWGDAPPQSAVNIIQTYIKHLRRALEPDRRPRSPSLILPGVGNGYALRMPAGGVDLQQFRDLVNAAANEQRAGHPSRAALLFGEALALWRGPPLANVALLASHPKVLALVAEQHNTIARYGDAMLAVGAASEALPALVGAAAAQPLDEAAHARLIRAYHAAGRRGQAIAVYHTIRARLADELGVDPGPGLADAHAAILHEDQARASVHLAVPVSPAACAPGVPAPPVPAQLPSDIAAFTGRDGYLRELDKLLPGTGAPRPGAVAICLIQGTAGIGKTTLAVRWAQRVADRFPDGQLYLNLRGFDPTGRVVSPADGMRLLLEALGLPPQRLPGTLDAQVGLYRTMLSRRRVLILLDNAREAEQVRPLLPGSSGCLVVVTSRNQLTGLVAADGAQPLTLELLSGAEARALLARRLGEDRLAGEPEATDEIVRECAGLPLALSIAAARAAARPGFGLKILAQQLREARGGLDAFAGADAITDVRTVFSWSYQGLAVGAARLFRLLACHPGPVITLPAAASLAGVPVDRVRPNIAELTRAHMLVEQTPGRYAFHDLLRAYATEVGDAGDTVDERRGALHRLLDHYLHTASAAMLLLRSPQLDPNALDPPQPGTAPETFADARRAGIWLAAEHRILSAVVMHAAAAGFDRYAWQLARTLVEFMDFAGHWHDQITVQHIALDAARRLDDRHAQAGIHRVLARAHARLDRFEEAHTHAQHALELYGECGDQVGQADAHRCFGWLLGREHRHREAVDHQQQALMMFRAAADRDGESRALNALGWSYAMLDEYGQALSCCRRALVRAREIGYRHGEAIAWDTIGYALHHLGRHRLAVRYLRRAITRFREVGDRYFEAEALTHLGDTHDAAGHVDQARGAWLRAIAILDKLGHPDADQVRARLRGLTADGDSASTTRDHRRGDGGPTSAPHPARRLRQRRSAAIQWISSRRT
ncbi:BTAD domain-containing putative transcriptional regulator [Krasilnikovia sp. M28-CT-15]|uniref:AfsR/SARP family transcriptional regulator n=1 Tax=Krasilnikovia sp. M28-CT-15 TaxID=3373540 RepID=UPI0038775B5E